MKNLKTTNHNCRATHENILHLNVNLEFTASRYLMPDVRRLERKGISISDCAVPIVACIGRGFGIQQDNILNHHITFATFLFSTAHGKLSANSPQPPPFLGAKYIKTLKISPLMFFKLYGFRRKKLTSKRWTCVDILYTNSMCIPIVYIFYSVD